MLKARTGPKTKPEHLENGQRISLATALIFRASDKDDNCYWEKQNFLADSQGRWQQNYKTAKKRPCKAPQAFRWDPQKEGKPELAHPSKGMEASAASTLTLSGWRFSGCACSVYVGSKGNLSWRKGRSPRAQIIPTNLYQQRVHKQSRNNKAFKKMTKNQGEIKPTALEKKHGRKSKHRL